MGSKLKEQHFKQIELQAVDARSEEIQMRRRGLCTKASKAAAKSFSGANYLTNLQLKEAVIQFALLDVLCHLDEINNAKKLSVRDDLKRCSLELERLNRARDLFNAREHRVCATGRLAVELAE
jgi:hypothetical protein